MSFQHTKHPLLPAPQSRQNILAHHRSQMFYMANPAVYQDELDNLVKEISNCSLPGSTYGSHRSSPVDKVLFLPCFIFVAFLCLS